MACIVALADGCLPERGHYDYALPSLQRGEGGDGYGRLLRREMPAMLCRRLPASDESRGQAVSQALHGLSADEAVAYALHPKGGV